MPHAKRCGVVGRMIYAVKWYYNVTILTIYRRILPITSHSPRFARCQEFNVTEVARIDCSIMEVFIECYSPTYSPLAYR